MSTSGFWGTRQMYMQPLAHIYKINLRKLIEARQWWFTPLIPALRKQRGRWISEFGAGLIYRMSFRIVRTIQRNSVLKRKRKKHVVKVGYSCNFHFCNVF